MIGKKLRERYELLERIGGGGTAIVYKAKDTHLNRIVAVKVLRSQFVSDDDFVKRFRREAQSAASLSHPNIVNIFDIGVVDDIHFIVMEYVQGPTLKQIINDRAPLPVEEAVSYTEQIAEALREAHHNQIIHRDIKPHNILISRSKRAKVTDFGIARAVSSSTITHTGSVMGSVHYFSPEQARGGMTGEKSDIYSLGIVLYEMLTGDLPFSGESPISVALKHLQDPFTAPRELNPHIPQSVENVITRSLAKDVRQRYDSASDLIIDLQSCLDPERLAEPKYELEEDDEEATKLMPALNENMYESHIHSSPVDEDETINPSSVSAERAEDLEQGNASEIQNGQQKQRSKKRLWMKLVLIALVLFILGFGSYQGYQFVSEFLYVEDVEVADVLEMPLDEAIAELEEQGLVVENPIEERHSDEVESDHVLRQDPAPGRTVKQESPVKLTVSMGPEEVEMPSLIGLSESNALRMLGNLNIDEEQIRIEEEHSFDMASGNVISQIPDSREPFVPSEAEIVLTISKGVETFDMPNLIGLSRAQAESVINQYDLILESVEEEYHDAPEGEVYRQHPVEAGQEVQAKTPIYIWVSQGNEETEKTENITITLDEEDQSSEDEEAEIVIQVEDVDGQREVINEAITETQTFDVDVTVSRYQPARIDIYINGELEEEREVSFDE